MMASRRAFERHPEKTTRGTSLNAHEIETMNHNLGILGTSNRPNVLLSRKKVPSWYRQDYIYGSYRPVTYSVKFCLKSLSYLHNETLNIYTHLIPALICFFLLFGVCRRYFESQFPNASRQDRLIFEIYLSTSFACFIVSSLYHTLLCHSQQYFDFWVRIDYSTIILQILGSFVSGVYVGFYCEPELRNIYWSMIGALGAVTAFVVVHPKLQSPRWRWLRTSSFVATGLSAFAPIIHAATIFPYDQLDQQAGLRYYYFEGVLLMIGVFHFTTHFPECWRPGKFDIWGGSHQIFHVLVALSAAVHFYGILSAFRWNYENPRCSDLAMTWHH